MSRSNYKYFFQVRTDYIAYPEVLLQPVKSILLILCDDCININRRTNAVKRFDGKISLEVIMCKKCINKNCYMHYSK